LDAYNLQSIIQIEHINRKAHAERVNAMAGDDPESRAVTEVIGAEAKQSAKTTPVRVGNGKSRGEVRLARAIECLPVRGEKTHSCPVS
jgi:hypothetical protein